MRFSTGPRCAEKGADEPVAKKGVQGKFVDVDEIAHDDTKPGQARENPEKLKKLAVGCGVPEVARFGP